MAVEAACYTSSGIRTSVSEPGWRKKYSVDRNIAFERVEHSVGAAQAETLAIAAAVATMVCSQMAMAGGPEMQIGHRASSGDPAMGCSQKVAVSQDSGAKTVHAAEAWE